MGSGTKRRVINFCSIMYICLIILSSRRLKKTMSRVTEMCLFLSEMQLQTVCPPLLQEHSDETNFKLEIFRHM